MAKEKTSVIFPIMIIFGIFLFLDGILSLLWGNSCLNTCFNNSAFGNSVRVIRAIIGFFLIVFGAVKR